MSLKSNAITLEKVKHQLLGTKSMILLMEMESLNECQDTGKLLVIQKYEITKHYREACSSGEMGELLKIYKRQRKKAKLKVEILPHLSVRSGKCVLSLQKTIPSCQLRESIRNRSRSMSGQ